MGIDAVGWKYHYGDEVLLDGRPTTVVAKCIECCEGGSVRKYAVANPMDLSQRLHVYPAEVGDEAGARISDDCAAEFLDPERVPGKRLAHGVVIANVVVEDVDGIVQRRYRLFVLGLESTQRTGPLSEAALTEFLKVRDWTVRASQ